MIVTKMVDALLFIVSSPIARIVLLIALLSVFVQKKRNHRKIQRWKKSLHLKQHTLVFNRLFNNVDGFKLSRIARQTQKDIIDYTYGEIEFLPFIALLSLVKIDNKTIFYDLGSGTGKAVLACAMVYPLNKSIGIELFSPLYQSACKQKKRLQVIQNYKEKADKIEFILGNFLDVNLEEATLIFINSSTIFGFTWEKLCLIIDKLPDANTVITTSRPLISTHFSIANSTQIQMSWGVVFAYIHTRKTNYN